MSSMIFMLIIVVAVIAVLAVLKAKPQGDSADEVWPFYAKKALSQPEQILYFRLVQALPEHIVLAQVQLSRLLGVKKGNSYQAWFNRINRMSADFVVCNKDKALASAGIRIVRWQVKLIPDIATIQSTIMPDIVVKKSAP